MPRSQIASPFFNAGNIVRVFDQHGAFLRSGGRFVCPAPASSSAGDTLIARTTSATPCASFPRMADSCWAWHRGRPSAQAHQDRLRTLAHRPPVHYRPMAFERRRDIRQRWLRPCQVHKFSPRADCSFPGEPAVARHFSGGPTARGVSAGLVTWPPENIRSISSLPTNLPLRMDRVVRPCQIFIAHRRLVFGELAFAL